jgi:drug/metabolite transporter (DMT)-like permease
MRSDRLLTVVVLVFAWGSTFAAIKIGLESAPPLLFAGLRMVVGAFVLTAVAVRGGGQVRLRRNAGLYVLLALTNVALFFGLQTLALQGLPSGLAAVLIYLQPVLVGALAWWFLGEPLGARKLAGLLLGFAGIVAVSVGALAGHLSLLGIGYAVATAVSWAAGTILLKSVEDRVDPWWAIAIPFALGAVVLTVVGLLVEGPHVAWSGRFVLALLYAAVVGTSLAWVLWLRLLTSGEASTAATYIFFVPLLSLLIGAVVLGESVGVSLLVGAALVVAGVYLANQPPRSTEPAYGSPGRSSPDS